MQKYTAELEELLCLPRIGEKIKVDIEHCSFSNGLGKVKLSDTYKVKVLDDKEEPQQFEKMYQSQIYKFKDDNIQKVSLFYMMKPVDPSSGQHQVSVLLESKFDHHYGQELYVNITFQKQK